jgi:hypothetical protein
VAHTSATCILTGGQARCVGTVADRTAAAVPGDAELTINSGQAQLWMSVSPLISIFNGPEAVSGQLTCAVGLSCTGTGTAGTNKIVIHTTGAPDGSSAIITLDDAPPPADPVAAPAARQTNRRRHHHPHRRKRSRASAGTHA